MNQQTQTRAFVLGLDGVPWYLIEQWVEAGELEHFATLMADGAAGSLDSTTPATTPLAWPSIATGVRPDKHSIYGFRRLTENYTHQVYTGNDLQYPALWDMVSPALVGNVPMTYPAREIDGIIVAGMMTPQIGPGFTYPPAFCDELVARIPEYRIALNWSQYYNAKEQFLTDLGTLVHNRRELMRLLMEREDWRLFFFVYTAPDRLQHLIWDDDVLLAHYQTLDDILGEVMAYTKERDATLYVVSDHGFGPVHKRVALNVLLEQEGLLEPRKQRGVRGALSRLGVTKDGVMGALGKVGIDEEMVVDYLPQSFTTQVAKQIPGDHPLFDVDYSQTTAFVYALGEVYVNDTHRFLEGVVDPVEVPAVKRQVKALFEAVTDPETGDQMVEVFDGDDLFPTDPDSPDLVVEPRPGYDISAALSGDIISPTKMAANHLPEGIFFAWGADVQAGARTREATVYDVAPTVLHGLGESIPEHTDGRVLAEIFTPDSTPGKTAVRTGTYARNAAVATVSDDFTDVENRLRGLGYIE
ncbi:alkaline phosphatase family protein [Haladaptatus sp. GCM10025707]|uniref:alkaline phosphatase family protein n=1 Tax=unclassified Haladaptatus TaxID=2622732 RepID=UPI0023E84533|nr:MULTISPECIES: alkaline phosphatase family protein [unclassified Haladaptatus]